MAKVHEPMNFKVSSGDKFRFAKNNNTYSMRSLNLIILGFEMIFRL